MAKDYKVGYKKPPQKSQFQKGQSGNPEGRPRKSAQTDKGDVKANFYADMRNMLGEEVIAIENGKKKKLTTSKAIAKRVLKGVFDGEQKWIRIFLLALKDPKLLDPEDDEKPGGVLVVGERMTEEEWVAKYGGKQINYDEDDYR